MYMSNKKSSSVDSILRTLTLQSHKKVNMATPRLFKPKTKCLVFELLTEISTHDPGISLKREALAIKDADAMNVHENLL